MSDIKLNRRYPDSKTEDITDAYMRGVEFGRAMRMDENEKLREEFDKMDKWHSAELIAAMKENAKLRELVRDLWLAGSLCDAIPAMRLQAKGGDWRTMQERVYEALGTEVDA